MVLINNKEYFKKETIERLKTEFKFTQTVHIEMLLWDFEIFSQLSDILTDSGELVLKGGAATQIYLPPDKQRASRDIDFATSLTNKDIENALDKIKKKFEENRQNEEHFEWKPVPEPEEDKIKIEDLHCYDIYVPTIFGASKGKTSTTALRIDMIRYKELPFKKKRLESPTIFGLKLKPFLVITEGSLIADKILTLGDTTVGILAKKVPNIESYLKQIYDLTHLINEFLEKKEVVEDLLSTLEKLAPIEVGYKQINKTTEQVITDIVSSLEKRKYTDLDSSDAGNGFRDEILSFQGNYLNKPENVPSFVWAQRIGKLHFISSLIYSLVQKKINSDKVKEITLRLKKAEAKLGSIKREEIKSTQKQLITYFNGDKRIEKQLKHGDLIRIFYGVINIQNYETVLTAMGM